MHISRVAGGSLRILMSDTELSRFGATFSSLREKDPHTKATIQRILRAVCQKEKLPIGTVLSVEAAPTDGGCLLLITPGPLPLKEDGIHIFAPKSPAVLPAFADVCRRMLPNGIISSTLYAYQDEYRLAVYAPQLPAHVQAALAEFAPPIGGGKVAAAHIAEHGTPLIIGEALKIV